MVYWSRPPHMFKKFTHTPIITPSTCASHNTKLNPVSHPPTCARHKTSTAERVKPLINYPMVSHLHQIEGESKHLTQLRIPTGHSLLQPARKLQTRYTKRSFPVHWTPNWTVPHILASLSQGPHDSEKQRYQSLISEKKHQRNTNMDSPQSLNEKNQDQYPSKPEISPVASIPHKIRLFQFIFY